MRFRLAGAGGLVLTVRQLAPACRVAATARFAGRSGVNRLSFSGRVAGKRLAPGTYRVVVRAAANSAPVAAVTVVVLEHALGARAVAARGAARLCRSAAPARSAPQTMLALRHPRKPAHGGVFAPRAKQTGGGMRLRAEALGARFTRGAQRAASAPPRILLYAILAVAIALLAVAAAPRAVVPGAAAPVVTRHRAELALAGMLVLGGFLAAYLLR